jgi:hypothetical protein
MNIPNVLVITNKTPMVTRLENAIRLIGNPLPNIKKSSAYYVWLADSEPLRLWHISGFIFEFHQITINLGNSYVFTKKPNMSGYPPSPYIYLPITAFGLMQISPGTLVTLPEDISQIAAS